jgi:acyl-CoA synthetase (AMP-forming)/AMP-acid ligase II/3-hydroxymyristoyl/3-hydroxydecanoyl-(acyl carrier protein) dehydratase
VFDTLDLLGQLSSPRASSDTVAWRGANAVSWQEFFERTHAWRTLLRRLPGQGFALYHTDAVEFAAALFGGWHAGKTIYLPGDSLPNTCATMRSRVDGYLGEFASVWEPKKPAAQDLRGVTEGFGRLDPEFLGLVLYTSGTTGNAQPISKKLAQLASEVATLEKQFGASLDTADIISTVSHQHIYGLLFNVLWPLAAQRAIHAQSFSYYEELERTLAVREAVLVSSPAHLKRLPENPAWTRAATRLRAVFSSGGPLSFDVTRECVRLLGQVPIEVYGSSETGGIAYRQQEKAAYEPWTPLPGVNWRVNPRDQVIEVSSAHLPDKNWVRLADRVEPATNSQFILGGRVDQIAKIEGKRISLQAIESLLTASPWVRAARVLVLEGRRQKVAVFVVTSESGRKELIVKGRRVFSGLLRNLLSESIEPVGLPRIWRYLDALPVNAQGKTTHAELLAWLGRESFRPTQPRARLIEKSEERAVFELTAPRNLLYFDGHFSARPILPGIVQVDWVIAYGRQCFDLPPSFRGLHALKFFRLIPPEMPIVLELVHDVAKSSLAFKVTSRLGAHAKGQVIFGAANV